MSAVAEAMEKHTTKPTGDAEALTQERHALRVKREQLFGFEKDVATALDLRLKEIESALIAAKAGHGFPRLDPVVLSWRHPQLIHRIPVPQLAPMKLNLNSSHFAFDKKMDSHHALPRLDILRYYNDVLSPMRDQVSDRTRRLSLSFTYGGGAMPDDLRARVLTTKDQFSEVFLLAEAPLTTWTYKHSRRSRWEMFQAWRTERTALRLDFLDPIVIGYDDHHMWVIGSFDPTPVEQYVMEEFTAQQ